jgi:hypothetical protein
MHSPDHPLAPLIGNAHTVYGTVPETSHSTPLNFSIVSSKSYLLMVAPFPPLGGTMIPLTTEPPLSVTYRPHEVTIPVPRNATYPSPTDPPAPSCTIPVVLDTAAPPYTVMPDTAVCSDPVLQLLLLIPCLPLHLLYQYLPFLMRGSRGNFSSAQRDLFPYLLTSFFVRGRNNPVIAQRDDSSALQPSAFNSSFTNCPPSRYYGAHFVRHCHCVHLSCHAY